MAKDYSGTDYIDGLLSPSGQAASPVNSWSPATTVGQSINLTYDWMIGAPASAPAGGFQAFSAEQRTGAERAMDLYAAVADITFTLQPNGTADIEFGTVAFGGSPSGFQSGLAYLWWTIESNPVNTYYTHADVYLTNSFSSILDQTVGGSGFSTMLHELGHALGLEHTFENRLVPAGTDSEQYSAMSYTAHPDMNVRPSTPLLYDIAALQYLYGANTSTRTGDDTYGWDTDGAEVMAIWDAGGNDTIDASNQVRNATINLANGGFSSIGSNGTGGNAVNNIAIAYGANIENATGGSGDDTITGNELNNDLYGSGGNDSLNGLSGDDYLSGGSGTDTLVGGTGDDKYRIYGANDSIVELAGEGSDRVYTSVDYTLGSGDEIELFTTHSSTSTSNIDLTGNEFTQTIIGNAGNNYLRTGGSANPDVLRGLGGDDKYRILNANDQIIENSGQGNDRVYSSVDYVLGDGVHVEVLSTSSSSGTTSVDLTGNRLSQTIYGNAGNNYLKSGGGDADQLIGFGGDDRYRVYNAQDEVIETSGRGYDRVYTSVDYQLSSNAEIELFTTNSSSGTSNIDLVGNAFAQTIIGNAGDNFLKTGGGSNADILRGLGGDDKYRVFNASDDIIELPGHGNDRVYTSVDFALGAGDSIETFTTNSSLGTTDIDLIGNGLDQLIIGNSGDNRIDGGDGTDVLRGLAGNDVFVFSTELDVSNIDEIVDFSVPDDQIELESSVFAALPVGVLTASAFRINNTGNAQDSDDRIIYDQDSGCLHYDADGSGGTEGIQFADISSFLNLSYLDFDIV